VRITSKRWRCFLCDVAGAILGLLLLESLAFFHIVDYRNSTWLSDDRFDEKLIAVHRPHTREIGSSLGGAFSALYTIPAKDMRSYQWDLRYDRNGFRNAADWKHADVVVTGSSYVEGMTIPDAQLMTTLLARDTGSVVLNLGHNAYGPQQELLTLERYGLRLHPKTVIWTFVDFVELKQEMDYRSETKYGTGLWSGFLDRSLTRRAYRKIDHDLKQLEEHTQEAWTPEDVAVVQRSGLVRDAQGQEERIYFLHPATAMNRQYREALRQTAEIIGKADRLCAAQGARLIVVFIPDQFRVFHSFAEFDPRCGCRRWVLDEEPQLLRSAVRSISPEIGYVDLTPFMTGAVQRGIIPYYTDDNHWSAVGHQIAAAAISEYLSRFNGGNGPVVITSNRTPAARELSDLR